MIWLYTVAELIVAAKNVEMMAGGHTIQVRQTILFAMVAIPHTICMGSCDYVIVQYKSAIA